MGIEDRRSPILPQQISRRGVLTALAAGAAATLLESCAPGQTRKEMFTQLQEGQGFVTLTDKLGPVRLAVLLSDTPTTLQQRLSAVNVDPSKITPDLPSGTFTGLVSKTLLLNEPTEAVFIPRKKTSDTQYNTFLKETGKSENDGMLCLFTSDVLRNQAEVLQQPGKEIDPDKAADFDRSYQDSVRMFLDAYFPDTSARIEALGKDALLHTRIAFVVPSK